MQITTSAIKRDPAVEAQYFEGCSEAPKGCAPCCDKSGEAHHLGSEKPAPVSDIRDLLLTQ